MSGLVVVLISSLVLAILGVLLGIEKGFEAIGGTTLVVSIVFFSLASGLLKSGDTTAKEKALAFGAVEYNPKGILIVADGTKYEQFNFISQFKVEVEK